MCLGLKFFLFSLFPSHAVLDFAKLYATTCKSFVMSCTFRTPSLSPRYFVVSAANIMCLAFASHPYMRKNGEKPEDSVGKKL